MLHAPDSKDVPPPAQQTSVNTSLGILARGSLLNLFGILYDLAARLAFNVIVARLLGPGPVGLYFLALSVLSVLAVVAQGGFDTALVRFLARHRQEADWARVSGTLRFSLGAVAGLSLLLAVALALGASTVSHGIFGKPELVTLLELLAVAIPLIALETAFLAVTQAFKEVKYKVYIGMVINPTGRLLLTVLFLKLGWGLEGVLAAYLLNLGMTAGLAYVAMQRCLPAHWGSVKPQRSAREVVKYTAPLFGVNVVTYLRRYADLFVLSSFRPIEEVGVYAVCLRLATLSVFALSAVSYLFAPMFVELHSREQRERSEKLLQTATLWAVQIFLPVFLLFLVGGRTLLRVFGDGFSVGASCLVILMLGQLANVMTGPVGMALNMSGATRLQFWNAMGALLLQVGLAVWLIPSWGLLGAATANATGLFMMNFARILQLHWLERIHPFSFGLGKAVGAAVVALLIGLAAWNQLDSINVVRLILLYSAVAFTYVALLFTFGFDEYSRLAFQEMRCAMARYSFGLLMPRRGEDNL